MTNPTELSLDVDRLIPARPETVFRCLSEPELYVQWFGPDGAEVTVETMELTLGGALRLSISFPGTEIRVDIEGFYEVIDPPHTLVHTWRVGGEQLVTTVRFDLEPVGSQTHLRIHHRGFVDPVDLEQNQGGWVDHLTELCSVARSVEGGR